MSITKVIIIDCKRLYGIMRHMEKLYTVIETMELLRISRPTLYRFIKSGQLVPLKMGKKTLFTESELDRFLEDLKSK
jgi:excisionase family DNA binding protein